MADPGEPEAFDDVNQAVRDEWRAETTPYERIREVISRTYIPTDADTLADEACTSPKTARKHLNTLAGDGFVTTETGTNGATLYRRSAESLVVEQAGDILSQVSTEELRERIAEMREQLTAFQREYGVESPDELAIDRTNELLDEGEQARSPTTKPSASGRPHGAISHSPTPRSRLRTQRNSSKPDRGRILNPFHLHDR
jgi:predicted ArsR family transcriptional regulator